MSHQSTATLDTERKERGREDDVHVPPSRAAVALTRTAKKKKKL